MTSASSCAPFTTNRPTCEDVHLRTQASLTTVTAAVLEGLPHFPRSLRREPAAVWRSGRTGAAVQGDDAPREVPERDVAPPRGLDPAAQRLLVGPVLDRLREVGVRARLLRH